MSIPTLTSAERAIVRKLNRLDPDRLGYHRPLADNPKPPAATPVPAYPGLPYYSQDELAAMDSTERGAAERLASPEYEAMAEGDCLSCHSGPRLIDGLCFECADPKPIVAKPSDTNH